MHRPVCFNQMHSMSLIIKRRFGLRTYLMSIENTSARRRRQHSLAPKPRLCGACYLSSFVPGTLQYTNYGSTRSPRQLPITSEYGCRRGRRKGIPDYHIQRRRDVDNLLRGRPPYGKGFCLICFHTKAYWGQRTQKTIEV